MPSALPSPHSFLTSLFSSPLFHTAPPPGATPNQLDSPLPSAALSSKPLLLTLHCLFPSEFLPALNLLDRRLVRRYVSIHPPSSLAEEVVVESSQIQHDQELRGRAVVYYVRSSQRVRHHAASRHDVVGTSYEVRTRAWNCTCPALALATFAGHGASEFNNRDGDGKSEHFGCEQECDDDGARCKERLGGLGLGSDFHVCKHLLACVLVERCGGLEEYVETTAVERTEMAGRATGWDG